MNTVPRRLNEMPAKFGRPVQQLPACSGVAKCVKEGTGDDDGRRRKVNGHAILRRKTIVDVDNLTDLLDKSEAGDYLKRKFLSQEIYSWAGQALLVLHPYCDLPLKADASDGPSVGSVVTKATFKLTNGLGKANQCIVISGDSGSGKTYSACLAIKHVGEVLQSPQDLQKNNVLWRAWSHVPLLTAFGNASTQYNDNSSRFGKLLQMQYKDGKIVGAYIQTYMLEKSRVSGPNRGESNFHIFNQILENIDPTTLAKFYIHKDTTYKICPPSENQQHVLYGETLRSMQLLQITRVNEILKILSIILNLGNIEFLYAYDKLTISNSSAIHLQYCAKLLECDVTELSRLFLKRLIAAKLRRATLCYTGCVNIEECEERRNSLMRYLYERLFLWLVKCVNDQTYCREETNLLGILDIYGFESFETNTFEQLCINYANERLQQYFIENYIAHQMDLAKDEFGSTVCVTHDMMEYKKRISLLDGTSSVFGILNEECLVKRYNTDVFICARLSNTLRKCTDFIERGNNISTTFSIIHFAGPVEYDCKTMVSKNRDKVPEEMLIFLNECGFSFVGEILVEGTSNEVILGKTLLSQFKKSLDKLMNILNESDVHYVKCLKPNLHQISGYFDDACVLSQLKYNGIMDILSLKLQNFPFVLSMDEFITRFQVTTSQMLDGLKTVLGNKMHIGKAAIYLTENGYKGMILLNKTYKNLAALKIQGTWKRHYKNQDATAKVIEDCLKRLSFMKNISEDQIVALSRKQSRTSIPVRDFNADFFRNLRYSYLNTYKKNGESLGRANNGDPISQKLKLMLEKITIKPFRRNYFRDKHIVSKYKLPELPVRIHMKKTCLPHVPIIPRTEIPQGLPDIF